MLRNPRVLNLAGALLCLAALGYAWFAQVQLGLEPCPLCIFQRITIAALAAVFVIAALHGARSWGRFVHAGLIGLTAAATVGVAGRHIYIQSLPPGSMPSCGAPLDVMLRYSPWLKVIGKVLTASGECSVVNWRFLGLSMPVWVLAFALVLGIAGIWANVSLRRTSVP